MTDEIIGFDEEGTRRVVEAVRTVEERVLLGEENRAPGGCLPATHRWVKVTSATASMSNMYQGVIVDKQGAAGSWTAGSAQILIEQVGGAKLMKDRIYLARSQGIHPSYQLPVFEVAYADLEQMVRVKTTIPDDNGYYDACLVAWTNGSWIDGPAVWAVDANP